MNLEILKCIEEEIKTNEKEKTKYENEIKILEKIKQFNEDINSLLKLDIIKESTYDFKNTLDYLNQLEEMIWMLENDIVNVNINSKVFNHQLLLDKKTKYKEIIQTVKLISPLIIIEEFEDESIKENLNNEVKDIINNLKEIKNKIINNILNELNKIKLDKNFDILKKLYNARKFFKNDGSLNLDNDNVDDLFDVIKSSSLDKVDILNFINNFIKETILTNETKSIKQMDENLYESNDDLEDSDKYLDEISNIGENINQIIKKDNIYKHYNTLNEGNKNYIDFILELINNQNIEDALYNIKSFDKPIEWFQYLNIIKKLVELNEDINTYLNLKEIDKEGVNEISDKYNILIDELKEVESNLKEINNENVEEIKPSENLVIVLDDKLDELDTECMLELKEALDKFRYISWEKMRRDTSNLAEALFYITSTGKRNYYENSSFKPYRLKCRQNTRTGIIKINVSPSIATLIQEKYNINNANSIFILTDIIKVISSDHNEYDRLTQYINNNYYTLEKIAQIFKNDEIDKKIIFDIIDNSNNILNLKTKSIGSEIKK